MDLAKLQEIWTAYHDHERLQPVEDEASRKAREESHMSGSITAYAESSYMKAFSPWNARHYDLLREIERIYVEVGDAISARERRLVEAGANTAGCCNNYGEGYAWCSVTWPEVMVEEKK